MVRKKLRLSLSALVWAIAWFREVEVRRAACSGLLTLAIGALVSRADAETPTFAYTSSGSCVASPMGFNSKLEPVNAGVAWRTTFNAMGSADAKRNVTEVGQSVDSASFGVGPRMHLPAANAYEARFVFNSVGPAEDGSFGLRAGTISGTFTAGPNVGVSFTISGVELKGWKGENGLSVYGSTGLPVIQTISLSNGTKFQRICTMQIVSAVPHQ